MIDGVFQASNHHMAGKKRMSMPKWTGPSEKEMKGQSRPKGTEASFGYRGRMGDGPERRVGQSQWSGERRRWGTRRVIRTDGPGGTA